MNEIKFIVYGEPIAQKRHRHFSRGGFTRVYDPSQLDKRDFGAIAAYHIPDTPFDEPLLLVVRSFFKRPKSHFRTGKFAGILKDIVSFFHSGKPDVDNLGKFVMDSLSKVTIEGVVRKYWADDSRVSMYLHLKAYDNDVPRTEIEIYPLSEFKCDVYINPIQV
jgi:Holliday junction resolvase RusA-like endonuclease